MTYKAKQNIKKCIYGILVILLTIAVCLVLLLSVYHRAIFSNMQQVKAEEFDMQTSSTEQGGVVFLGDSITEMYDLEEYFPNKNYINRGIGSNETKDILERLQTNVIDIAPKTIVFLAGTNDIGHGVPEQDILDNMQKIFSTIYERLPNTKLLVQSVYPTRELDNLNSKNLVSVRPNDKINQLNQKLQKLCETFANNGMNIHYLDIHYYLTDEDGKLIEEYTVDGLHINSFGYEAISNFLTGKI